MILIPNVGSAALLKEKELLAAAPTCSPASTLPTNHHVCLVFMSCTHGGGAYFEAKCGDSNLLEALYSCLGAAKVHISCLSSAC